MRVLRQNRYRRAIVATLALAWLPYISLRCVPAVASADPACDVLPDGGEETHHHVDTVHHEPPAHDHEGPCKTCCELTGKLNVTLAPPLVSVDPQVLAALPMPLAPEVGAPEVERVGACDADGRAHAPPLYLRNSALRI